MKEPRVSFSHFLEKFPEIDLPVTLNDESHHLFSRENDPLPEPMIAQFIHPVEEEADDECTEYIACFRLKDTHGFHAVVYWRAGLMNYHYMMVTFTKQGDIIDKRVIGGTFSDGETLTQAVGTIDEDWEILIVSGQSPTGRGSSYDAATSTAYKLDLLPDGTIVDQD